MDVGPVSSVSWSLIRVFPCATGLAKTAVAAVTRRHMATRIAFVCMRNRTPCESRPYERGFEPFAANFIPDFVLPSHARRGDQQRKRVLGSRHRKLSYRRLRSDTDATPRPRTNRSRGVRNRLPGLGDWRGQPRGFVQSHEGNPLDRRGAEG